MINDIEIQENRNFSNNQKISTYSIKKFLELISTAANMIIRNKIFEKRFLKENNINFFNHELLNGIDFMLKSLTKSSNFVIINDYAGYT